MRYSVKQVVRDSGYCADMDEELECGMCNQPFTNPMLLRCMHTFCEPCIQVKKADSNSIECPTCSFQTKVSADGHMETLRNHAVAAQLKEHTALKMRDESLFPCNDCGSTSSTQYCYDCKWKLCTDCTTHHRRCIRYKGHRIQEILSVDPTHLIVQAVPLCLLHKEVLKYVCETCQMVSCVDCSHSTQHQNHKFRLVTEVAKEHVDSLLDFLPRWRESCNEYEECLEKVTEFNEASKQDVEESKRLVEGTYSELIEILKNEKIKLLDWLEEAQVSSADQLRTAWQRLNIARRFVGFMEEMKSFPNEEVYDVLVNGLGRLEEDMEKMQQASSQIMKDFDGQKVDIKVSGTTSGVSSLGSVSNLSFTFDFPPVGGSESVGQSNAVRNVNVASNFDPDGAGPSRLGTESDADLKSIGIEKSILDSGPSNLPLPVVVTTSSSSVEYDTITCHKKSLESGESSNTKVGNIGVVTPQTDEFRKKVTALRKSHPLPHSESRFTNWSESKSKGISSKDGIKCSTSLVKPCSKVTTSSSAVGSSVVPAISSGSRSSKNGVVTPRDLDSQNIQTLAPSELSNSSMPTVVVATTPANSSVTRITSKSTTVVTATSTRSCSSELSGMISEDTVAFPNASEATASDNVFAVRPFSRRVSDSKQMKIIKSALLMIGLLPEDQLPGFVFFPPNAFSFSEKTIGSSWCEVGSKGTSPSLKKCGKVGVDNRRASRFRS